jgi:hypothetical protein
MGHVKKFKTFFGMMWEYSHRLQNGMLTMELISHQFKGGFFFNENKGMQ